MNNENKQNKRKQNRIFKIIQAKTAKLSHFNLLHNFPEITIDKTKNNRKLYEKRLIVKINSNVKEDQLQGIIQLLSNHKINYSKNEQLVDKMQKINNCLINTKRFVI